MSFAKVNVRRVIERIKLSKTWNLSTNFLFIYLESLSFRSFSIWVDLQTSLYDPAPTCSLANYPTSHQPEVCIWRVTVPNRLPEVWNTLPKGLLLVDISRVNFTHSNKSRHPKGNHTLHLQVFKLWRNKKEKKHLAAAWTFFSLPRNTYKCRACLSFVYCLTSTGFLLVLCLPMVIPRPPIVQTPWQTRRDRNHIFSHRSLMKGGHFLTWCLSW